MNEKPKAIGATGGALGLGALALAIGGCCGAPWAVALLGVGAAVLLARLAFIQPYLVVATALLAAVGFWYAYRPLPATAGESCPADKRTALRWVVWIGALIVIVLDIASFVPREEGAAVTAKTSRYAVLDAHDQPLREDFNRDRGTIRLLFLVDPVCPECLRGLADMGDDLLRKLPTGAPVNVYVVHEPVIGGSSDDIRAAAALLGFPIARHYWNPSGDFGREMSHVLGYWNGARWVYAWDTWLIYPADATWTDSAPPQPVFLMHQLGGLPRNGKFPHLDADVFAAKVQAMLPSLNAKNVSR